MCQSDPDCSGQSNSLKLATAQSRGTASQRQVLDCYLPQKVQSTHDLADWRFYDLPLDTLQLGVCQHLSKKRPGRVQIPTQNLIDGGLIQSNLSGQVIEPTAAAIGTFVENVGRIVIVLRGSSSAFGLDPLGFRFDGAQTIAGGAGSVGAIEAKVTRIQLAVAATAIGARSVDRIKRLVPLVRPLEMLGDYRAAPKFEGQLQGLLKSRLDSIPIDQTIDDGRDRMFLANRKFWNCINIEQFPIHSRADQSGFAYFFEHVGVPTFSAANHWSQQHQFGLRW